MFSTKARLTLILALAMSLLVFPLTARADFSAYLTVNDYRAEAENVSYTWTVIPYAEDLREGDPIAISFRAGNGSPDVDLSLASVLVDGLAQSDIQIDNVRKTLTIQLASGMTLARGTTHVLAIHGVTNPSVNPDAQIVVRLGNDPAVSVSAISYHGDFDHFVIDTATLPTAMTAGLPGPEILVRAVDRNGATVMDFNLPVLAASDDPATGVQAPKGLGPLTFIEGEARFTPVFQNAAISREIIVSLVSDPFQNRLGTPYRFVVRPNAGISWRLAAPTIVTVDQPFGVTLTQLDEWGNPVASSGKYTLHLATNTGEATHVAGALNGTTQFVDVSTNVLGQQTMWIEDDERVEIAVTTILVLPPVPPVIDLSTSLREDRLTDTEYSETITLFNRSGTPLVDGALRFSVYGLNATDLEIHVREPSGHMTKLRGEQVGERLVFRLPEALFLNVQEQRKVILSLNLHREGTFPVMLTLTSGEPISQTLVRHVAVLRPHVVGHNVAEGFRGNFIDLAPAPWAASAIENLAQLGIVQGKTPGRFAPSVQITRAEFVALLVRTLGLSATASAPPFDDVSAQDWFAVPVAIAASHHLVEGDGYLFYPDRTITRQEMAVILGRAIKAQHLIPDLAQTDSAKTMLPYRDLQDVPAWAEEGLAIALNRGLFQGRSANLFAPEATATRAESALVFWRLIELMP